MMLRKFSISLVAWAAAVSGALGPAPAIASNVLLVVDAPTLTSSETARKTQFETWGHTVTTIQDNDTQTNFNTAMAAVDVVYIPMTVDDWEVTNKCKATTKGVVCEERYIDDDMGFSTGSGWSANHTQTEILNNSHPVTSGLSTGYVTIVSSTQELAMMNPTVASGMTTLSEQNYAAGDMLGVMETGAALAGGGTAAGRRVRLPWGGDAFSWSALNTSGRLIAEQAIEWASGGGEELLLHWKLNEASGTTANDSSTYNRDGTVTGTASWTAGRRHNAFNFNGSTKIEVNGLLGNPSDFTLACWARIDAADSTGAEGISVGDYLILRLHNSSGGPQGVFFAGGSTWRTVSASTSYIGAGWHHFAVTFDDAANSLKLYIDGVNVATTSTTSSVSWSGLGTKTRVGTHGNTNTTFDLDGAVDDVRVYNRALTLSEVVDLYGLVGHWKLIETSGSSAADSSGKGNNGTYTNSPTLAQAGPYPGAGQYAPSYDGTNDYVNGPAATTFDFADGFSVAGWVNLDANIDSAAMLQNGATTNNCELAFSSTGQIRVSGRSSGGLQTLTSTATLPLRRWKHVVGSYNGSTFKIYVDGVLVSSSSNSFTVSTPSGNLTLGASLEGTDQFLDGRLHDVRLYNRALADEEAAELYGLVGDWELDETSGTVANDASALGNDGAYTNSPTLGQQGPYPGVGQYAVQCDGTNDHVALGSIAVNMSKGFAIAAWVKPTGIATNQRILDIGRGTAQDNIVFGRSGTSADLRVALYDGSSGDTALTATGALAPNEWHHYVAIGDNAGNGKIYRDGQLVASGSIGTPSNVVRNINYIARSSTSGDAYYQGRLFDVRLYNRPLSTAEIAEIYGLTGHWKLDEGSGTTVADSSGIGTNAAFNSGAPTWISGIYANALQFNGTTDDVRTSAAFTPPTVGTIAFWMRSNGTPAATIRPMGLGDNWEVRQSTSGTLVFDIGATGDSGGFYSIATPTSSNTWYHVVATYDMADNTYAVYVNGVLDKSGTSTADLVTQSAAQLSFGTRTGAAEHFPGALDDIRVYNRKLSAWEVSELYGLMAWYKLDESSGTVATDSTGRGNDGAFVGSPSLAVTSNGGPSMGTAVGLNGANYVQVTGLLGQSPSVSVAGWAKLDAKDSSGADFVSLGDCFVIRLANSTVNTTAAYHLAAGTTSVDASGIIEDTGWHHFAAVLDAGNTLKLYIDGNEKASVAATSAISYSGLGANTFIGRHGNSGSSHDFTGRVDDVRIFNRAIKPDEVYLLYRGSRINGIKILTWTEAR